MIDEPPAETFTLEEVEGSELIAGLPTQQRPDGSLLIDLTPLGRQSQECQREEPDPINPEIVVCREATLSPRIGPNPSPQVDDFGNAVPRARIQLSEDAEAEANMINKGVGGFNANGGEVRVKIDF